METAHVIVVVNEPRTRQLLVDTLGREGVHVSVASSDKEGLALIERQRAQVLVADMDMQGHERRVPPQCRQHSTPLGAGRPGQPVGRELGSRSEPGRADGLPHQAALRRCGPLRPGQRAAPLPRLETRGGIAAAARCCRAKGPAVERAAVRLVADRRGHAQIVTTIAKIAPSDAAVLIEGESGTGKKLLAQEIHRRSRRCSGPLVRIACGALRESENRVTLFGQAGPVSGQAGPISGQAGRESRRRFQPNGIAKVCRGGTLFLDDLTQLPLSAQVKMLDLLQDGQAPAGGGEPVPLDVRVIASVSRNLEHALAHGLLLPELYFYLNIASISIFRACGVGHRGHPRWPSNFFWWPPPGMALRGVGPPPAASRKRPGNAC